MSTGSHENDRLTRPSIILGASTLALVVTLALTTPAPDPWTVLVFAALYAFAQNSDIEGPSDIGISAGFMIAVATIVVFATERTPLGAVLVGLAGVLFVPHLVHREWRKILCNAGARALSLFAGVVVLLAFPPSWLTSFPGLLVAASFAAIANFVGERRPGRPRHRLCAAPPARDVLLAMAGWQWHLYPFALVGIGLGWLTLHEGPVVLALAVTPILVGRQAFLNYVRLHSAHEATLGTLVQALDRRTVTRPGTPNGWRRTRALPAKSSASARKRSSA